MAITINNLPDQNEIYAGPFPVVDLITVAGLPDQLSLYGEEAGGGGLPKVFGQTIGGVMGASNVESVMGAGG